MYRLLRLLFIGTWELPKQPDPCNHKWEIIQSTTVDGTFREPLGHITKTSQCTRCGDLINHKIN